MGAEGRGGGGKRSFVYTLGGVSTVMVMSFGLCFGLMDSVVEALLVYTLYNNTPRSWNVTRALLVFRLRMA